MATSDKEKADLFADYFENEIYAYTPDELPYHGQISRQANKIKEKKVTRPIISKWEPIAENEVKQHIKQLRNSATGLDNILRLERYAEQQLHKPKQRRHSAVILFDIKAAFDSVWHDGLIYKLNDLRLPRYLVNYLISFLHNRTAAIEVENVLSRPFKLRSGIPQGSPLSPLLYIMYTADSMNGIPTHTERKLFADDTALWTSSNGLDSLSNRLQQSIDAFESWCKSWKLRLQPTKTELVYFSLYPRRKRNNTVVVKVDNIDVKPLGSNQILGCHHR